MGHYSDIVKQVTHQCIDVTFDHSQLLWGHLKLGLNLCALKALKLVRLRFPRMRGCFKPSTHDVLDVLQSPSLKVQNIHSAAPTALQPLTLCALDLHAHMADARPGQAGRHGASGGLVC